MPDGAAVTDQERYHSARRDSGLVVIEGFHALKHALRFGASITDVVSDDVSRFQALVASLAPDLDRVIDRTAPVRAVAPAAFDALSPVPHPTRVIALAERPCIAIESVFMNATSAVRDPIVVLDDPRHAGNIGAAIRVAAAAGAAGLFVTGAADPWQPAAVRGGAGLQFALPVARIDAIPPTDRAVIGVDPEGEDPLRPDERGIHDGILVFGSERDGIGDAMSGRVERRVRIPMRAGVSSLNLATAVAVLLYHGR